MHWWQIPGRARLYFWLSAPWEAALMMKTSLFSFWMFQICPHITSTMHRNWVWNSSPCLYLLLYHVFFLLGMLWMIHDRGLCSPQSAWEYEAEDTTSFISAFSWSVAHCFHSDWNTSTTIGWITIKRVKHLDDAQNFHLSSGISQHLVETTLWTDISLNHKSKHAKVRL